MIRFTVRSMLFITTLVAAFVTMSAQAEHGPTPAGIAAVLLYCALMGWAIFRPAKASERPKEPPTKPAEEGGSTPTNQNNSA